MSGFIQLELGTNGPDTFTANAGEILIAFGFDDSDTLTGAELGDFLFGGNDADTISGGAGNDFLDGGDGDDNINTGAGDDVILAGSGDDSVGGMAGRDTVLAGDGDDSVIWNDPTGDTVFGEGGDDFLRGGDVAADTILGGDGDDLIRAVANQGLADHAPDFLAGDAGNDAIIGGNADDTIEGGTGDDDMSGFGGADRFVFRAGQEGSDKINDFDSNEDLVVLEGFDAGFDPLANISQSNLGAVLDLGSGNEVLFFGLAANELGAEDFVFPA